MTKKGLTFLGVTMENLTIFGQRLKKINVVGNLKDIKKFWGYRKLGTLFRTQKFFVSLQL